MVFIFGDVKKGEFYDKKQIDIYITDKLAILGRLLWNKP